jgi:uncharacterized protein YhaN
MKILALDFRAFGPFTNERLDFSGPGPNLHLIHGPNEAGKSSALRALKQTLYGIPHQSADDFIHDHKNFLLGATLEAGGERVLTFFRRKGRGKTLLAQDEKAALDEQSLAPFLGGVSQADFERLFSLDHDRLVAGGRALATGGGDMGESLFAAGAGVADLGKVRKTLEEEAKRLFLPKGELPAINKGLSEIKKAREARRSLSLRGEDWQEHDRNLARARAKKEAVDQQLDELRGRLHRLTRIHDALPAIGRRVVLLAELETLTKSNVLPEDFSDRFRDTFNAHRLAQDRERHLVEDLAELDETLAGLVVDERLLARSDEITSLHQELASQRKSARDCEGWRAERDLLLADAEKLLRELQPEWSLADAEKLRLPLTVRIQIQDLGNNRQSLEQAKIDARLRVEKLTSQLAEARQTLAMTQPEKDLEPLKEAMGAAVRRGLLEEALEAAVVERSDVERQTDVDLQKLGLWEGSWDELEQLAAPSAETIEQFRERMSQDERARGDIRASIDSETDAARNLKVEWEQLRQAGEVPTESDLKDARIAREQGWRLVKAAWMEGRESGADVKEYLAATGVASTLSEAYERSVAHADLIADRLRQEARRVEAKVRVLAEIAAHEEAIVNWERKLAEAEAASQALQDAWTERWRAVGIAPQSPREMAGWMRRHDQLVEKAGDRRKLDSRVAEITRQIAVHRFEIDTRLVALGEPAAEASETLAALVTRAQRLVTQSQSNEAERRLWNDRISQWESERPAALEHSRRAEDDLARWREAWTAVITRVGLDENATPAQAYAVVGRISTLCEKIDRADEHRRAMESRDREAARFATEVRALRQSIAPDLAEIDHGAALDQLHRRLLESRRTYQERELTLTRKAKLEHELKAAQRAISQGQSSLDDLRREAGGTEIDAIPTQIRLSDSRRSIERRLASQEDQISTLAGGSSLSEFIVAAEAEDPDGLIAAVERHNEQLAELDREKEQLNQEIGRQKMWLAAHDGGSSAAASDEDVEDLRARIEDSVAQYAPLRLATAVLDQVIERYRQKNQDPVLGRAGGLFARLTRGSFVGLDGDGDDKNRSVLVGVRGGDRGIVGLSGMSDGTADQLFLALRLAILDTFLDSHEHARLPFVLDDILINFDNQRAAAALHVLSEFSRKTQVLFFTHHEHLIELARAELGPAVRVHHLGPAAVGAAVVGN